MRMLNLMSYVNYFGDLVSKSVSGSHHLFRRKGVDEKLNLQRDKSKAKVYQVRQVRSVIVKYGLGEDE
jgi:hypothetical protein